MGYILAIDQGTTSSRAMIFDAGLKVRGQAQAEFPQIFPHSGWVEHDPEQIWSSVVKVMRDAVDAAGIEGKSLNAIGITNQRETVVIWDRATGKPIHNAIVWQDRRTARDCDHLRNEGLEAEVTERTGLILDPYFSATKIAWILDQVEGARERAARGELAFGTIDSFLIWRLTGGTAHVTDASNACRTMLYDIGRGCWDETICKAVGVPMAMLPEVRDSAGLFGRTEAALLGAAVPILGVAGDQQAATMGQACFKPGMMKSTYGTGCFALVNTGSQRVTSSHRMLTTIAWQLKGEVTYALEGSIFIAGAVVQWLRDGLGIIASAPETQGMAEEAEEGEGLVMVPAFTGLGAPWWEPDARGAIYGLTRNSGPADFARAALESVGHQTRDLWQAMRADWPELGSGERVLRVDGGMSASDWTVQYLADILGAAVDRPRLQETTTLGVAWLAGWEAGLCPDMEGFAASWELDRRFEPRMSQEKRRARHARWSRAVESTIRF